MAQTKLNPPDTSTERNPLVTIAAAVIGAILIVIAAVFSPDSITGERPAVLIILLRAAVMAVCFATYGGVMLYYSKRNAEFRAHLESAMSASDKDKKKKKGK